MTRLPTWTPVITAVFILVVACGRFGLDGHGGLPDAESDADNDGSGGQWVELAGSASGYGVPGRRAQVSNIGVVAGHDGIDVVWGDFSTGIWQVCAEHWDGARWVGLAGSDQGGGLSNDRLEAKPGAVAQNESGRPQAVWMGRFQDDWAGRVYMRSWTGTAWDELGSSASGTGISAEGNAWWPSLVLDSLGRPVVAWEVYNLAPWGGMIYLRRWSGSRWTEVDGSATLPGLGTEGVNAHGVHLATGPDETLHAVWLETVAEIDRVRYCTFDGTSWQAPEGPGDALSSPGTWPDPANVVVLPDGSPVLCWTENTDESATVLVVRRDGTRWSAMGDLLAGTGLETAFHPHMVVDPDGRVVVAFGTQDALGVNVHVHGWDGTSWRPEPGCEVSGGVSATSTDSVWPHLAWGPDGPVLAWEEFDAEGVNSLHLKVWR